MKVIDLSQVDKEAIVQVLNESFADYIIPLQLTVEQLENKIAAENIQLHFVCRGFRSREVSWI